MLFLLDRPIKGGIPRDVFNEDAGVHSRSASFKESLPYSNRSFKDAEDFGASSPTRARVRKTSFAEEDETIVINGSATQFNCGSTFSREGSLAGRDRKYSNTMRAVPSSPSIKYV